MLYTKTHLNLNLPIPLGVLKFILMKKSAKNKEACVPIAGHAMTACRFCRDFVIGYVVALPMI